MEKESYLKDCYIVVNEKDKESQKPLFTDADGVVTARLEGYAIIPMEEYKSLKFPSRERKEESELKKLLKKAYRWGRDNGEGRSEKNFNHLLETKEVSEFLKKTT